MKKIIKLTESDLTRIVKRVLNEQLGGLEAMPETGYDAGVNVGYVPTFEKKNSTASLIGANSLLAKTRMDIAKIENEIKKPNQECNKYKSIKKPNDNTKDIQDFLISIGHKIKNDNKFTDETATALGTYFYGHNQGINTVDKLINRLKIDGYVIGKSGGLNEAVSKKINKIIDNKLKKCYNDNFKRTEELKKLKSEESKQLKIINSLKNNMVTTKTVSG
jgi:hypothetical protein